MFAQTVQLRIKPQFIEELTIVFDKEIIPLLRKQDGFQDQITFILPSGMAAVGISLWNEKENAEAYLRELYPTVLKALAKVFRGTPKLQTFEVANSTFHTLPFRRWV
jgi:hypothetical protein